jgi:hypothetical protein
MQSEGRTASNGMVALTSISCHTLIMDMRDPSLAQVLAVDHREAAQSQIAAASLPIMELSGTVRPAPAQVTGWEGVDAAVTTVRVIHDAGRYDGPVVEVSTSRWGGTQVSNGPLRQVLEHHLRQDGERFSSTEWTVGSADVVVDGRVVAAEMLRAGDRWWAVRCENDGIEISIAARDWRPDAIEVETVTDVPEFLSRALPDLPPFTSPVPMSSVVPPETLNRDPHRALVDVNVALSQRTYQWLADGGPAPEQVPYLSALWRAAVRRQMALTDQAEAEAKAAVTTIVEQLNNLYHNAQWFRDDSQLREKATLETILFWTQLDPQVASSRAQRAWRDHRAGSAPDTYDEVASHAATAVTWQDAWEAWARADTAR